MQLLAHNVMDGRARGEGARREEARREGRGASGVPLLSQVRERIALLRVGRIWDAGLGVSTKVCDQKHQRLCSIPDHSHSVKQKNL